MTGAGPAPLPSSVDIVVVGGGIVGLCVGLFVAEAGREVAVLDHGGHAGSAVNAGSLHVQMQSRFMRLYPDLVPGLEAALPLYPLAVRHWQALARDLGEDVGLRLTGGLMVAEDQDQIDFLAAKCRRERELGLEVEMLGRAELDRVAPYLGPAVVGAELCPIEGKVDPLLANAAIRRRLLRAGAGLFAEVRVERLARADRGYELATSRGLVRAARVVIAAGAGSRRLAADLGLHVPAEAEPLHMNITEATAPFIIHLVQHADRQITLKQLGAGQVVIGGGWPASLAGPDRHPTVELASIVGNLSLAQHVVPGIGPLRLLRTWAGVNTTVDGRSVLGGVGDGLPGLTFAIPGDAGYTLGPLCARLAADAALGRATEVDIGPYSPLRFGQG